MECLQGQVPGTSQVLRDYADETVGISEAVLSEVRSSCEAVGVGRVKNSDLVAALSGLESQAPCCSQCGHGQSPQLELGLAYRPFCTAVHPVVLVVITVPVAGGEGEAGSWDSSAGLSAAGQAGRGWMGEPKG